MNFFDELKRRKVVKTLLGYLIGSGAVAGLVWLVVASLGLPQHFVYAVIILALVALPLVVALAWAFDITPTGVERTGATPQTSRVAVSWKRAMLPLLATILILLATVSFVALKKSEQILNNRGHQTQVQK